MANNVQLVGRSFKYHRPRGIVGSGAEEPNAILQIGSGPSTEPVQRATQVELYDGLTARSVKGWPSLRFDLAIVNDVLSRVFSAGFYYKTFMHPARLWSFFEHRIRSAAGLGEAPKEADPDFYTHINAHCDVLVAGGGPAGLMAAKAAALSGARVIVVDDQDRLGGQLLGNGENVDGLSGAQWASTVQEELATMENVTVLTRSTVFGYYDYNFLAVVERCTQHLGEHVKGQARQRLWRVRAKQVVLAQGAIERPLVFSNNDRPGVMLAGAVCTYINRYGVLPGRRAVVFTNNDSGYQCALDLHRNGAFVMAVVDSRVSGGGDLAQAVVDCDIRVLNGCVVTNVIGRRSVKGVEVLSRESTEAAENQAKTESFSCDLLAVSGGFSPAVHLHSQSGGHNVWDDQLPGFVPGEATQNQLSAGAGNGKQTLAKCQDDGIRAGNAVSERCGFTAVSPKPPEVPSQTRYPIEPLWRVHLNKAPEFLDKQFVDFQNDTTVTDIRLAVREGFHSVEHVKRYTALGFGTDQGKLGNINGMAILAETLGKTIPEVGTTTFRPAYTPVTFGAIAGDDVGDLYEPVRKTALHAWHEAQGAPFEIVGQWLRPWYFPKGDEDIHAAVRRECLAARNSLAIMDASTLGKIDVRGKDATTFLERIYTHNIGKMKIGRCAYGIMLGEDGMVMDDGVMARLGEQHYYLTTTTGGAAAVLSWLELWLQTEWPELEVYFTSLTDHYSTIALVGPESRNLLQRLRCDIDVSRENFPFMSVQDGTLEGVPVQLFRISFSGELAFEVNVDSNYVQQVWDVLMREGASYDITPYGTETLHVLRAEKGFVIVGQDTDGSVNPKDLGMNWLLSKEKDYLGLRSLERSDSKRSDRKQFIGLVPEDRTTVVKEGAQLLASAPDTIPAPMEGRITSSYDSPTLQHPIALGLLNGGRKRKGEVIVAVDSNGKQTRMSVVSPVFYDPKSERQRV
ncbi:MAG: sarcosine oxidase subunit alpha family protein [Pseudomonadota bacterium]